MFNTFVKVFMEILEIIEILRDTSEINPLTPVETVVQVIFTRTPLHLQHPLFRKTK